MKFTYELLYNYCSNASINSISWSPSIFGCKLAACNSEGNFFILAKIGNEFNVLEEETEISEPLNAITWAPDFSLEY